jgi:hypothetical protein
VPSFTTCIYFSDTGGGHRSPAEAIQAGMEQVIEKELPAGEHGLATLRI